MSINILNEGIINHEGSQLTRVWVNNINRVCFEEDCDSDPHYFELTKEEWEILKFFVDNQMK